MRLVDILSAPWAITANVLDEIQGLYTRHMRGEKIDLQSLAAATGVTFASEPKGYEVMDGVAVLAVDGVIAKRMNLFSKICGGVSSELVGRDLAAAMADRSVEAVVLAIDSPGGTVDGTPELAAQVYAARGTKPIIAHTDGMMCSAAYWIGSAADQVLISSEVAQVGSIGVVAKHIDVSKAEEKSGVKTTEIYAGKYKRIASQYEPLSEDGRASIQETVDHVYSVFVDGVATHRGTTAADVLARMADGRVFSGSQAIEAGLVDGVATLAQAMDKARAMARTKTIRPAGVAAVQKETSMELTLEKLKADHPDLVLQIVAEANAEMQGDVDQLVATAKEEGAAAERQRIADVRAQTVKGYESLIESLAFDGKSTGADAAMAIVAAEQKRSSQTLADLDDHANPPVASVAEDIGQKKTMKRTDFDKLSATDRRETMAAGVVIVD